MSMSFGSRTLGEAKRRFAWQVRMLEDGEAWSGCMWQRFCSDGWDLSCEACAYAIVVGWSDGGLVACVGAKPLEYLDEAGDTIESWTPIYDPDEDWRPVVRVGTRCSYRVFWTLWHRAVRLHASRFDPAVVTWCPEWWDGDGGEGEWDGVRVQSGMGSEALNGCLRERCPQLFRPAG